jgi:hypothetical protein
MEGKGSLADVYCLLAVGDGTEFPAQWGGLVVLVVKGVSKRGNVRPFFTVPDA